MTDEDIAKIAGTYHAWRGDGGARVYVDEPGFCRGSNLDEIGRHGHVLTPGRYVGSEAADEDEEVFDEKMRRLTAILTRQREDASKLDAAIWTSLKELGYGR